MPYPEFDRSRLVLKPLAERKHDFSATEMLALDTPADSNPHPDLAQLAQRIVRARQQKAPVILMMGAHVIKTGLSRFIIDLLERGVLTHVALNGAGAIHDFELALIGATSESVARYIRDGQFGMWQETGRINAAVAAGVRAGMGFGESVGRMIADEQFPQREISILNAGYRLRVPVTVHISLGCDIIHQHPNCDGAALGAATYRDFLIYTQAITQLQGGVMLNLGTAIMGPEVYLKALSMARNVARQDGRRLAEFTTAVFDLHDLGPDVHHEAPKSHPQYYYRPFKTILVRTVQDGGASFYIRGEHRGTVPALYRELLKAQA
jgi:hypothetical protein